MFQIKVRRTKKTGFLRLNQVDEVIVAFTSSTAETLSAAVEQALHAGVDLTGGEWTGRICLPGADLRGARMGTRLHEADFSGANLERAKLGDLTGADLSHARLAGASVGWLERADLRHADLSGVNLRKKTRGAKLEGADVQGASIEDWDLRVADYTRCSHLADLRVFKQGRQVTVTGLQGFTGLERLNWEAILKAQSRNA